MAACINGVYKCVKKRIAVIDGSCAIGFMRCLRGQLKASPHVFNEVKSLTDGELKKDISLEKKLRDADSTDDVVEALDNLLMFAIRCLLARGLNPAIKK